jgi:DNA-directed RNA polymerase specialized sigma24 family protein
MTSDVELQHHHLKLAVEAAQRGDVRSFVLELAASHALDGVLTSLHRQWPRVEVSAVEAIVAEAADALYEKIAVDHGVVGNASAYLWGTARNIVCKRYEAGVLDTVPLTEGLGLSVPAPDESDDRDVDALRDEALRRARALLPGLGQETVQRVMAYIFEGVEKGDMFLDNAAIGAALGLTTLTVRRSMSRGFQRLKEAAQREGIDMAGVLEVSTSEQDDEEAGDE